MCDLAQFSQYELNIESNYNKLCIFFQYVQFLLFFWNQFGCLKQFDLF